MTLKLTPKRVRQCLASTDVADSKNSAKLIAKQMIKNMFFFIKSPIIQMLNDDYKE